VKFTTRASRPLLLAPKERLCACQLTTGHVQSQTDTAPRLVAAAPTQGALGRTLACLLRFSAQPAAADLARSTRAPHAQALSRVAPWIRLSSVYRPWGRCSACAFQRMDGARHGTWPWSLWQKRAVAVGHPALRSWARCCVGQARHEQGSIECLYGL
jgi:hypothetical protein